MTRTITCSIACLMLAASFCDAGFLPKPLSQSTSTTTPGTVTPATPGKAPTADQWKPWRLQYRQAQLTLEKAQSGSPEAAAAQKKLDEALANGKQLAAGFTGGFGEVDAMLQFVRDWKPAEFTTGVIEKLQPHADRELDTIMLKPEPFPRFPVRNFLLRWQGIDTPAGKKAMAQYDAQAKPAYDEALATADDNARAKALAAFIIQWKPSTLVDDAYAQRQKIADAVYEPLGSMDDFAARRRGLTMFVRDFPDSKQVEQAQQELRANRSTVSQRGVIDHLDRQLIAANPSLAQTNTGSSSSGASTRTTSTTSTRSTPTTTTTSTGSLADSQNREVVQNQGVERDTQNDEGGGRGAHQGAARQGAARQGAARQAAAAQSKQGTAKTAQTNDSQKARTGEARNGQVN